MNTLEVQCLDVVAGMLNKQTAAGLGVAEKTIRFHRAHIMRKMRAESVAELVRMAAQPAAEATKA
jgi:FixJ family two-component response regulator